MIFGITLCSIQPSSLLQTIINLLFCDFTPCLLASARVGGHQLGAFVLTGSYYTPLLIKYIALLKSPRHPLRN